MDLKALQLVAVYWRHQKKDAFARQGCKWFSSDGRSQNCRKIIHCAFVPLWEVHRVLGGTTGRRGIRCGGLYFYEPKPSFNSSKNCPP